MKSISYTILILLLSALSYSCTELTFGDEFLGDRPEQSGATLDTMFSSALNAELVLTKAYTYLPYGLVTGSSPNEKLGGDLLESLTDINHTFRDNVSSGPINLYYNGGLTASSNHIGQIYRLGFEQDWDAIRYAWIYIENIDKVPDMTDFEKEERKAEAKTIIAIAYSEMLRNIGGIPWIDHAVEVNEEMYFPRLSFGNSVNKIIALIDEAIPHLKWKQDAVEDGRMTSAGAMALKLRILLFAASPTFNNDNKWHTAADSCTWYGNYDPGRWERARKAGEDFFNMLNSRGGYALTQPAEPTHQARRLAFRSGYYDRGGTEVLISTRKGFNEQAHRPHFAVRYYMGPTLDYVNMFSWEDGTDFPEDFDWSNPSKEPFYDGTTPTREPRLYETAAVPGERYFNGSAAPVYLENPNYRIGSNTGFMIMKFILPDAPVRVGRPTQWPYLRFPEVLLSYAEAINEAEGMPNSTAYWCVNEVRGRVGLPPLHEGMTKEAFREAVLKERALELGFEEVRWYDIVRWGKEDIFRKKLCRLEVNLKEGTINEPESFSFKAVELPERFWSANWETKWYLSPIPQNEVNKGYGLTQNPGW